MQWKPFSTREKTQSHITSLASTARISSAAGVPINVFYCQTLSFATRTTPLVKTIKWIINCMKVHMYETHTKGQQTNKPSLSLTWLYFASNARQADAVTLMQQPAILLLHCHFVWMFDLMSFLLSLSQGESVKYFLDNLEKLGQSVSPTHSTEHQLVMGHLVSWQQKGAAKPC